MCGGFVAGISQYQAALVVLPAYDLPFAEFHLRAASSDQVHQVDPRQEQ